MISAVVDTNVLVSGFGWARAAPANVVEAVLAGRFLLVSSPPFAVRAREGSALPEVGVAFPQPDEVVGLVGEIAMLVKPGHV